MFKEIYQHLGSFFKKSKRKKNKKQRPLINAGDDTALVWSGNFGQKYTKRNFRSLKETDDLYKDGFGITRSELNHQFLDNIDRNIKILEVGSNIGNQLLYLQEMGFKDLYGIDVQIHALELAKSRTKEINLIHGSAFDIPFKDGFFDFVFTSGVLIHIRPEQINLAMDEIYRCTKRYIWCWEIYAPEFTSIPYINYSDLCYKADYAALFLERFDSLRLIKEEHFEHRTADNPHRMFLLEKAIKTSGNSDRSK